MKKSILSGFFVIAALAVAFAFARQKNEFSGFKPAEDFPRGALIYVQFQNLPALIESWRGSGFRAKLLAGAGFGEFQQRHLGRKLVARFREISDELGVAPDLDFLASLAETSAAVAVYDIGRTEFVLVAPMSKEKLLASQLFALKESFETFEANGVTVYRKQLRVDNQRELQQVFFAAVRGRLVVSTAEARFRQTLEHIRRRNPAASLAREPDFAKLAATGEPHLATVWLNQAALSKDWYFRKYWAMSDVSKLENCRAGRFDFETSDDEVAEHRVFLMNEPTAKLARTDYDTLAGFAPANASYADLRPLAANVDPFAEILIGRRAAESPAEERPRFTFYDWEESNGGGYLGEDFDESIVGAAEEAMTFVKPFAAADSLRRLMETARPVGSLTVRSPEKLAPPYFFDDRKAVAVAFANPERLSAASVERAVAERLQAALTVEQRAGALVWSDLQTSRNQARVLEIPSIGRRIALFFDGKTLIVSNDADLLRQMLDAEARPSAADADRLTVINLRKTREMFGTVFAQIENESKNTDGFTANIASLLDSFNEAEKLEITERSKGELLYEELKLTTGEK